MARATSGLGQFRGKVGAVVFRVSQGQQIASAYQPAVRNPKSNLQTAQRNKMYLASQLSKLVPREDIIGLAPRGTARDRRNMFIKGILDNSVSRLNGEVFSTSVMTNSVLFSNGNAIDGIVTTAAVSGNNYDVQITFDKTKITEDVFNRLAIKLIQFDIVNDIYSNYKSSYLDLGTYNTDDSEDTFTKMFSVAIQQGVSTAVYLVPIELNENVRYSSEKKTLVQVDTDNMTFVITGQYDINNAVLKWYKSRFVGATDGGEIVPPSTGGDEVVNPDGPSFPNIG